MDTERAPGTWHRFVGSLATRVLFEHVDLVAGPHAPPGDGPVVWVALHRNGAVDGWVYRRLFPRMTFLIARQLLRTPLARMFFSGIEVVRAADDEDRSGNAQALRAAVDLVRAGGQLCVFPEGTSSLGPRHLPFKSGAARIILDLLDAGATFQVLPLGIHYDRAWAFGSSVEVVVGEGISCDGLPAERGERLEVMQGRLAKGLEAVGINVGSAEEQRALENYATLRGRPRWPTLMAHQGGVPPDARALLDEAGEHVEVTELPMPVAALVWLPLASLAAVGALANLPPLLAGAWAARHFADDRNVVTLWRALVGLPVWWLWMAVIAGATPFTHLLLPAGYAIATVVGMAAWAPARRLGRALTNPRRARLLECAERADGAERLGGAGRAAGAERAEGDGGDRPEKREGRTR